MGPLKPAITAFRSRMIDCLYRGTDVILGALGSTLVPLFPRRTFRICESGFTLINSGTGISILDTVLRAGIAYRTLKSGNTEELVQLHRNFWQGRHAAAYHDSHESLLHTFTLPYFGFFFEELQSMLGNQPIDTAIEIGCGNGRFLDFASRQMSGPRRWIGIDLCPETIEKCRSTYPNLQWVAADATEWIRSHAPDHALFISHHGVFEYFTQQILSDLFAFIASRCKPAAVALIEPVGALHNLETTPGSQRYGMEYSFSHNYPHLLRTSGFDILLHRRVNSGRSTDFVGVIASV